MFLNPNDVDKRLRKLKVDIGNYNTDTKRLSVTVTNNYSEDVLGYNDNKDSDIKPLLESKDTSRNKLG